MNGDIGWYFYHYYAHQTHRLYYQYDSKRVTACPLTIHALLHIASDTRHLGPLSHIWEFATERSMGSIARSVKNKKLPFAQLAETVKVREQLKMVMARYRLAKELSISRTRRDWGKLSSKEQMILEISTYFCVFLIALLS